MSARLMKMLDRLTGCRRNGIGLEASSRHDPRTPCAARDCGQRTRHAQRLATRAARFLKLSFSNVAGGFIIGRCVF